MLGWRMGARVVVFGCCPHVAQHRRLQEYASLSPSLSHSLTHSLSRNPIHGRKKRTRTSGRGASVYKLVFCYKVSIHVQFFDALDSGGCAPFLLRILLPHKILCLHVSLMFMLHVMLGIGFKAGFLCPPPHTHTHRDIPCSVQP